MRKAIYREYRPKTFDEVLGQSQVTEVLKNQVKNNLIGHAYIFSGTRGTGKTSCAKIFARAINCLNPQEGSPCNKCENCKTILSEETFDIVEMDAASNRRIEDIRDLRDKVIYPPANLKYKVYIIDEVHMITNEGFNALLKIMEEPPKHLVFILATTEIEKIPPTILSRCQRYEFKRLDTVFIKENIAKITRDLNLEIEEEAVNIISNEADGAMRDALSTLDQVVSLGKTKITVKDLEDDLGLVDQDKLFNLVDVIINKDFNKTLEFFEEVSKGKVIANIFKDLSIHYRNLLLAKNELYDYIEASEANIENYKEQSQNIEMNQIVESMDILMEFEVKLKTTENPVVLGELLVTRLIDYVNYNSFKSKINFLEDRVKKLEQKISNIKIGNFKNTIINSDNEKNIDTTNEIEEKIIEREIEKAESVSEVEYDIKEQKNNGINNISEDYEETEYWDEVIEKIPTPILKGFLKKSTYRFIDNKKRLVILFKSEDSSMKLVCSNIELIQKVVSEVIGSEYEVYITIEANYGEINKNRKEKNLKIIQELFGEENIEII